jgi:hypothetical protein
VTAQIEGLLLYTGPRTKLRVTRTRLTQIVQDSVQKLLSPETACVSRESVEHSEIGVERG